MKIERKKAGDVTILAFTGEFDAFNLPTISEKIDTLIEKGGASHLVFNLKRLRFINSSALGYLIKTHKKLREYEGELVLSEPSKFFQTTIKTLGIDQIFKVFGQDEEAVKYFYDAGGEEKTFEGVPVDEKLLGSTTVFFRLVDSPETMAVGKILSIYEDGPTFKYPGDPDKIKIDPDDMTIGRGLWIKFRQPFLQKERFFEMEAEIVMAVDLDDGSEASKYRLRYTKIDDADRKILEQFVADQDLLRSEAKPEQLP